MRCGPCAHTKHVFGVVEWTGWIGVGVNERLTKQMVVSEIGPTTANREHGRGLEGATHLLGRVTTRPDEESRCGEQFRVGWKRACFEGGKSNFGLGRLGSESHEQSWMVVGWLERITRRGRGGLYRRFRRWD